MEILQSEEGLVLVKEREKIGRCRILAAPQGLQITEFAIRPEWRRRGYGTYLLKEVLRRTGGYAKDVPATHRLAAGVVCPGEEPFWEKQGFAATLQPDGSVEWVRCHTVDLTAVRFAQEFLTARLGDTARLCVDATCGNGGDTEFLCRLCGPQGRVVAMDIQPQALQSTRARLQAAGIEPERYSLVCGSHAGLLRYLQPGTADAVMFNFGWLPGAQHQVFSTAESSIPALEAALTALRPGGVLSAVLYSGKVIGSDEKQAVLRWLRALPLQQYTVLVCEFANWADTAPLPCFVLKK